MKRLLGWLALGLALHAGAAHAQFQDPRHSLFGRSPFRGSAPSVLTIAKKANGLSGGPGGVITTAALPVGAGGYVRGIDIEVDGTNPEIILTRTDTYGGYIWNTTTSRWDQLVTATSMPTADVTIDNSGGVLGLQAAPTNTNHLYMLYQGYVYSSVNRGRNWTKTAYSQCANNGPGANGDIGGDGPFLAVDPINENVVYTACLGGLVSASFDGGASWATVANVPAAATVNSKPYGSEIVFDKTSGSTGGKTNKIWIAVMGSGVYRSTNAGGAFSVVAGGPTSFNNLAMIGSTPVMCDGSDNSSPVWSYSGSAWVSSIANDNGPCQMVIADPTNANNVIALAPGGTTSISTTGPAGTFSGVQNWSYDFAATDIPWLQWAQNASQFMTTGQIAYDPAQPGTVLISAGIGVWRLTPSWSPTGQNHFVSQSAGIEQLVSRDVRSIPGGPTLYLAWDRAVWYLGGDYTQYPSTYGPGLAAARAGIVHGYNVAYQPGNPAHVVGIFEGFAESSAYSYDGGQTWTPFAAFPGGGFSGTGYQGGSIAMDDVGDIIWSPQNTYPYRSTDGGQTWTALSGLGSGGWGWAAYLERFNIVADKVLTRTFYAYQDGVGILRSQDGGANWTVRNATNFAGLGGFNSKLDVSPTQAGYLWFTGGPQSPGPHPVNEAFWVSLDAGATWNAVPNVKEVRTFGFGAAAPGKTNPSMWIVGWVNNVYGVWESDDATLGGTPTWTLVSTWPNNSIDNIDTIGGDLNVYGQAIVGFSGSGAAYLRTAGYKPVPVVYAQTVTPGNLGATIAWKTSEAARYTLHYGPTTAYGSSVTGASLASLQSVALTGLANYALVHFNIVATDASGRTFTSYDETFRTLNAIAPNAPSSVVATNIGTSQNNVAWTGNQGSDPQAITGYKLYRNGSLIATLGAVTSYSDTAANPNSTYSYTVAAFDASGNTSSQSTNSNSVTTGNAVSFAVTASPVSQDGLSYPNSVTFPAQSIGPASSDRLVLVFVYLHSGANPSNPLAGVTVGGVAATQIADNSGASAFVTPAIWQAAVPTGTAADVVVNGNGISNAAIIVGAVKGYTSATPTVSSWLAMTYQPTSDYSIGAITVPTNGVVISFALSSNGSYVSWSGLTDDGGVDDAAVYLGMHVGHSYVPGAVTPVYHVSGSYQLGGMVQLSYH